MLSRMINIWRKELMDSTRDRRALRQSIIIPVVIGAFYAVFNPILASSITARAQDPVSIPVQGIENASQDFTDLLAQFGITLEPFDGDIEAAIASGEQEAGLIIPAGFGSSIENEQPTNLTLLTNRTAGGPMGGSFSSERLDLAIKTYNEQVSIARVEKRDLDPALLTPINLDARDLASPEQLAGTFAALMLPILVGVIVVQGGLFIAIDVTAGEKERGTLEALLVTPASDIEVLVGKLAAVFTLSGVPLVLTFLGFWLGSNLLPNSISNGAVLPFSIVIVAIIVGLPLTLFINMILMIVSVRTKAFKDAQSAATPVIFGCMIPGFAAAFVPPTTVAAHIIPIYGAAAVVGGMATSGGAVNPTAIVLSVTGSLVGAAIAFVIALRFFNRERLLYSA
jgi:sodium transport system permease protein